MHGFPGHHLPYREGGAGKCFSSSEKAGWHSLLRRLQSRCSLFEIQGTPENLFGIIVQGAFHIDFRMGFLSHMIDVVEEIQMLFFVPA